MTSRLAKRFVGYLVVAAVAWATWNTGEALMLPGKLDEDVSQALARGERIDVIVELGFRPEKVHMNIFQKYGAVGGVSDDRVTILRVDAGRVRDLARHYWIKRVRMVGEQ